MGIVRTEHGRQKVHDDLFLLALTRLDEFTPPGQVLDAEGVTSDVVPANIRTAGDGERSRSAGFTAGRHRPHPALRGPGHSLGSNNEGDRAWAFAESSADREALVAEALPPGPFGNRVEPLERGDTLLGPEKEHS